MDSLGGVESLLLESLGPAPARVVRLLKGWRSLFDCWKIVGEVEGVKSLELNEAKASVLNIVAEAIANREIFWRLW
jgi:hypothetical protein